LFVSSVLANIVVLLFQLSGICLAFLQRFSIIAATLLWDPVLSSSGKSAYLDLVLKLASF